MFILENIYILKVMLKMNILFLALCLIASAQVALTQSSTCPFPSCTLVSDYYGCEVECSGSLPEVVNNVTLRSLVLTGFTSLAEDALSGLNITNLEIDASQLKNIQDGALRGVVGLERLTFRSLTDSTLVTSQVLADVKDSLSYLYVKESPVTDDVILYIYDQVKSLPNLWDLGFPNNNLTSVNVDLGEEKYLSSLDLNGNLLESINVKGSIGIINLNSNKISSIENVTVNSSSIYTIYFDYNEITSVPANAFANLDLTFMSLADNKITSIDQDAFSNMNNLKWLNLASNPLGNDFILNFPDTLKTLYLSYIGLAGFKASNIRVKSLEYLWMPGNGLEELPDDFNSLAFNVTQLYIYNNKIKSLSFLDSHKYEYLNKLEAGDNAIESVSTAQLENLPALNYLNLNQNSLTEIEFPELVNLEYVYLSENKINEIKSSTFENLANLAVLEIQKSEVSTIDPLAFNKNTKLRELNLNGNYLSSLPSLFKLSMLQRLSVESQNGKLKTVPNYAFERDVQSMDTSKELEISLYDNYITLIEERAFCNRLGGSLAQNRVSLKINNINRIHKCMLAQFNSESVFVTTLRRVHCFIKAYGTKYNVDFASEIPDSCTDLSIRKDLCDRRDRYKCSVADE